MISGKLPRLYPQLHFLSGATLRYFVLVLGLLIVGAYLELTVLLLVAKEWGWLFALASTILTGIGGIAIARSQGWQVAWKMGRDLEAGEVPVASMFDGLLLLVAGVLLLLPGLITDAFGLLLLIPWTRQAVRWAILRYWLRQVGEWRVYHEATLREATARHRQEYLDPDVIDGEIVPPNETRDGPHDGPRDEPSGPSRPASP
jgi:UPF0716 protein FxsA